MKVTEALQYPVEVAPGEAEVSLWELLHILAGYWKVIVGGALATGILALGISFLIPPTYTAKTTLLPPQQQQSSAAAALASLGPLAGLAGGAAAIKSPVDQYIALMQSAKVSDSIIDEFRLIDVYETKLRVDARKRLDSNVRISAGKKDGLITVEVDDKDSKRAADLANSYVGGLRMIVTTLAVSEAQQRRLFFEQQLQQTKDKLIKAQLALQGSGFDRGALKAEPKAAAEGYARLRAEVTAAEIKMQTMRRMLTDKSPELSQQQATLSALRAELTRAEQRDEMHGDSDYVSKYREFKYQEALFDLFARQYELARVDESREGALVQVVDVATAPERKSGPKRGVIAIIATMLAGLLLAAGVLVRHFYRSQPRRV